MSAVGVAVLTWLSRSVIFSPVAGNEEFLEEMRLLEDIDALERSMPPVLCETK